MKKNYKKDRRKKRYTARWTMIICLCILVCFAVYFFRSGDRVYPRDYRIEVEKYAALNELDENLVYALIKAESDFDLDAVSSKGAVGLMQLMPETAQWAADKMGIEYDESLLTDSEYNIKIGTWYLKRLIIYYENDINKAIAAYNGGEGNVDEWLADGTWDGTLANAGDIPFEETGNYLSKVTAYYEEYQALYE